MFMKGWSKLHYTVIYKCNTVSSGPQFKCVIVQTTPQMIIPITALSCSLTATYPIFFLKKRCRHENKDHCETETGKAKLLPLTHSYYMLVSFLVLYYKRERGKVRKKEKERKREKQGRREQGYSYKPGQDHSDAPIVV